MVEFIENSYCPLSRCDCRRDCNLIADIEGNGQYSCSLFEIMVSLNKIENLMELIRVEKV
jgi:hypothetical protein